jgi:NAD(P) transhydrogenase subunit alpha
MEKMKLSIPKETKLKENRVALTPEVIKDLSTKGFVCTIEKGAGVSSFFSDAEYKAAGAVVLDDLARLYSGADIVVKVNAPSLPEIVLMKPGAVLISFMFAMTNPELVKACINQGISSFSLDAIPRISRAQKMDALSSQSNLAGYKAVMLAANTLGKIFPMLMTAAGTIKPSKIVVMGAGVAGLQAVATAKRLGAIVEVSDIRPETKEQVESLGGKFIESEADGSIKIEGGYVKDVSEGFLKKQQETIGKHVMDADIVITTALVPGKKAPLLITEEMLKGMRTGSVVVDMAVEQGGNCFGSELDKTVTKHGVCIIGESNLPGLLPINASDLYARNIAALLAHLTLPSGFKWDLEDEITNKSLITHKGKLLSKSLSSSVYPHDPKLNLMSEDHSWNI